MITLMTILLLHPTPLLSSLRPAVFVLKGAPDGASIWVLLANLQNSLRASHLNRFVRSTLNSSLIWPLTVLIIGNVNYWKLLFWELLELDFLFAISSLVNWRKSCGKQAAKDQSYSNFKLHLAFWHSSRSFWLPRGIWHAHKSPVIWLFFDNLMAT